MFDEWHWRLLQTCRGHCRTTAGFRRILAAAGEGESRAALLRSQNLMDLSAAVTIDDAHSHSCARETRKCTVRADNQGGNRSPSLQLGHTLPLPLLLSLQSLPEFS